MRVRHRASSCTALPLVRAVLVVVPILAAACGPVDGGGADAADVPGRDDWQDTAEAHDADDRGDAVDAADLADALDALDAPEVDNPCPDGQVMIDFPCFKELECIDDHRFRASKTMWCEDLGYDPRCCGGGMCQGLPDGECAADETCVRFAGGDDRCVKHDCGAATGGTCPAGKLCELPAGSCDPAADAGVCLDRPSDCGGSPCESPGCQFECGCDGRTYGSACERRKAGVALASTGPCCDPAKLDFDRDDPHGHASWEACAKWSNPQEVLAKMDPGIQCGPGGAGTTCASDEFACRGSLARGADGRITEASWDLACRVGGLPYIGRVSGQGGPQCAAGPAPVPMCGAGCQDACGCQRCSPDHDSACVPGDPHQYRSCTGGCWTDHPCQPAEWLCARINDWSMCWADCVTRESWYQTTLGMTWCQKDADCHVVKGHCEDGLGPCWVPLNVNTGAVDLEGNFIPWKAVGCTGPACTCPPDPPAVKCSGERCVLLPVP